ncbi:MAG TPA: hypothetical protein PKC28_13160 [Bdellovibrionales bacterium]|nr:hypothetical protein [Bdellovibrionales bacterium]
MRAAMNAITRAPQGSPPATAQPGPTQTWKGLKICSDLDFKGLTWSDGLETGERDPFALALNISGSFEGSAGWANLSTNFDGQGMSMGLLNQNLGQGTLQPMWSEMRRGHAALMGSVFSAANLKSLNKMIDKWEAQTRVAALNINDFGYSELDEPLVIASELSIDPLELQEVTTALLARNQESVTWAKITLFLKSKFKTDWSKELKSLAVSAPYRSIQVRRAEALHAKTMDLMNVYKMSELRSYLFFFDIVVQNGGISSAVRERYTAWLKTGGVATEKQKLTKLLELRLTAVKAQYVGDVRARKMAILNGAGVVHGDKRDFAKEFCVDLGQKLFMN